MTPRIRTLASGVVGAAGLIAVLTLASRLAGFLRWLVQAWAVGATSTGSAYASANTIPNVLYEIVAGGALAGAVVPLVAAPLARRLTKDVDAIASALVTWALVALLPVALIVVLAARPLALAIVGSGPTTDLTADFLRVFALQIPLYGLGVVLSGVLQAQKRFLWPALAPLASTAVVLVAYVAYGALTAWTSPDPGDLTAAAFAWLAWGTTAGVAALSLPLLLPVARSGIRLRPRLTFPPGVAARARTLALAGLGTVLAQQVSVLATVRIANEYGPAGTLPVAQYANAVYALPYAVLAVPVATAVFPRVAEHLGTGEHARAARLLAVSTRAVAAAGFLGAALLAALAPTATEIFALRGPMPGMTPAVTALALGVVGYALMFHLTRALYALDAGGAAVRGGASGWIAAAAVSWALAAAATGALGEAGIAAVSWVPGLGGDAGVSTLVALGLGTTVGMTLAAAWLLVELRRAAGAAATEGLARTILVAALGAGLAVAAARPAVAAVLGPFDGVEGALLGAALGAVVIVAILGVTLAVGDPAVLGAVRRRLARRGSGGPPGDGGTPGDGEPGQESEPGPDGGAPARREGAEGRGGATIRENRPGTPTTTDPVPPRRDQE